MSKIEKLIWIFLLCATASLAFAGAPNMGMDPRDWAAPESTSITNPLLALFLMGVLSVVCFMFSIIRMVVYIFAVLLTLGGIVQGNSGTLIMGVLLLLPCLAGTLWNPEDGVLIGKKNKPK